MRTLSKTGMVTLGIVVGMLFVLHCGGGGSDGKASGAHRHPATEIDYDNVASGLTGADAQAVIDELAALVATLQAQVAASQSDIAANQTDIAALQAADTALDTRLTTAEGDITALDTRVTSVEAVTQYQSVQAGAVNGLTGPHLIFEGINVHVRSGSGTTNDGGTLTGLGNLVVGYNEEDVPAPAGYRDGSHNLITGCWHTYTSFGGFVAGYRNAITANYGSVSGGSDCTASGPFSSVSGGQNNDASARWSSVSGGSGNTASADHASVSGGFQRTATGNHDWAAGSLWEDF
jgi:hypothetical protein